MCSYLHRSKHDSLVVLVIIGELSQRFHRLKTILSEHVVKASDERTLTYALRHVVVVER